MAASCYYALSVMRQSDDKIHDHTHIESIISSLCEFMEQSDEVNWRIIDFDVLLLSICWHDVWKSSRRTNKAHKIVYYQIYEGLGSMRLFNKHAKVHTLPKQIVKKVKYAIRKHSMFQIFPTRQLEAKILWDMDFLDPWKGIHLKKSIANFSELGKITPRFISLFKLYFRFYMQPKSKRTNFEWTRNKIEREKAEFFGNLANLPSLLSGQHSPT